MKTKEYLIKYDLQSGKNFNHSKFIEDFTLDFMAYLEIGRKSDDSYVIAGFEQAVRMMRDKWDAIHNKTVPGLPETLWRFFYATVIIKIKNEMFPEVMEARRRKQQEYEERKNWRKEQYERETNWFRDSWQDFIFGSILKGMFKDNIPKKEFDVLGLPETADIDAVRTAYKTLVKLHHPDKGGKQQTFIDVTDAKNKCLAYLNNKK